MNRTGWTFGWALAAHVALAVTLLGCIDRQSPAPDTPEPDAPDAGGADGAPVDVGPPDLAVVDAAPDAVALAGEATHFVDTGRCFEHTPRCGADGDCDPALYRGCIAGRCHLDVPCGCASDDDCAAGDLCVTNERVCGICVPAPEPCAAGGCRGGDVCVDGWCREDCPGHGDGPPLDCRGEPDAGRCDGRWAYLRDVGTCVPVDGVGCGDVPRNAFDDRAACLTHCRGPAICSVTFERGGEDPARVECPITHGPAACVALAHCLCELAEQLPPDVDPREARRMCAYSWSVPRGAITLADFCGRGSVADVIAELRESGFAEGVLGPEVELRLSEGCAEVQTDMSIGPMCRDGVQNGWETGVDCGPQGCEVCP